MAGKNSAFYIDDWRVDPRSLRISRGDEETRLEPKVMQLLLYMSERPGQVVTRQELEDRVWEGTIVGYDALTNSILKLRKAFGDSSRKPRVIETIPKTGYRLIAAVEAKSIEADPAPASDAPLRKFSVWPMGRWLAGTLILAALVVLAAIGYWRSQAGGPVALALPDQPSIAVMPFLNTGNDLRQNYFADGITEDLITDLSKVSELFVIARNSSFRYKGRAVDVAGVAAELGVRFILQGNVRRHEDRVRINVQLTDALEGRNIWAERYDTPLLDLFAVQDRVTRQIIEALSVRLSEFDQARLAQPETYSPASYDEFLKGWERYWRFTPDDFAVAERHFKKALEIDPDNSRAHAGLALIYWQAWQQKWHENFGNPHAGWTRAHRELKLALVNPTPLAHTTHSSMLLYNRRFDQAIAEAEKAVALDRNHAGGYLALATALGYSGQPGRAIETAKRGMRLDPNFVAPYLVVLGRAQLDMGLYRKAVDSLERAIAVNLHDRDAHILLLAALGHLERSERSTTILEALQQEHAAMELPAFTMNWLTNRLPYRRKADRDHLLAGLEKARVPRW